MDVKTVILGVSKGGTAIADNARTLHDAQNSVWRAEEGNRTAGRTRI